MGSGAGGRGVREVPAPPQADVHKHRRLPRFEQAQERFPHDVAVEREQRKEADELSEREEAEDGGRGTTGGNEERGGSTGCGTQKEDGGDREAHVQA